MANSIHKITELKVKFLEYYRQLPMIRLAAGKIGRDEDTVMRWRALDADFAEQMASAKSDWALQKSKSVKSDEWLLERVLRDHFLPPKIENEVSGKIDHIIITREERKSDASKS